MKSNYLRLKLSSLTILLLSMIGIITMCLFPGTAYAGARGWSVVSSPNPSPTDNALQAVAALSTNKVWAVGYSLRGATKSTLVKQTLIEHYNGTRWQTSVSPDVGTGDNALTGVAAIAEKNVWAVGSSSVGALILHFDGVTWHQVSAPSACHLNAISAIAANDVWVVGTMGYQSCTEHFNGTNWSLISTPKLGTSDNMLFGVAASSSHNVWAVGTYCIGIVCDRGGGNFQALILHYNGSRWSSVLSPNPTARYMKQLNAVTVISAKDAWAVGGEMTAPATGTPLIVHFDGIRWTQVVGPGAGSVSSLTAIASASATDMFAVGFSTTPKTPWSATLIEHFNGTTWHVIASPSPGINPVLHGLTYVSHAPSGATQFWAVGAYRTNTSGSTLIERDI